MTTRHTEAPLKSQGNATCIAGPVWDYGAHFDIEADRKFFMEKAEAERLARNRQHQAEYARRVWIKKKTDAFHYNRRPVACDEAERKTLLEELRDLPDAKRIEKRMAIVKDLYARGYQTTPIARFLDVSPSVVRRDRQRTEAPAGRTTSSMTERRAQRAAYQREWNLRNQRKEAT